MRKGLNRIAGAVVMAISAGSAMAADHPALGGNWQAVDGAIGLENIDACATGGTHTCSIIAGGNGNGFVQYMATAAGGGDTYIGTIITDATANDRGDSGNLGFYDESFVLMQSCQGTNCADVNNGIVASQVINETGATDNIRFSSTVDIQTGLHFGDAASGGSFVRIAQSLVDTAGAAATSPDVGDDFMSDFMYEAGLDTAGNRTGYVMQIDQVAGLQQTNGTANDVQSFTYRERAGDRQQGGGGSLTIPGVNDASGSAVTVGYSDGDAIKAVWLGQEIGNGGGSFGYLSYQNKDSVADPSVVSNYSLTSSDAPGAAWDSTFNLQFTGQASPSGAPTLADPSGGL